jgi:hypothetical protein
MIMALSCTKKQPSKCHTTSEFIATKPLSNIDTLNYKAVYYTEIECDVFLVSIFYDDYKKAYIINYPK